MQVIAGRENGRIIALHARYGTGGWWEFRTYQISVFAVIASVSGQSFKLWSASICKELKALCGEVGIRALGD